MAISGLIMVGFLVLHMWGNLRAFAGADAFNEYAHHLRTLGEPMLTYGLALWANRVILLAAVVVHAWSAITLWARSNKATGKGKRYETRARVQRSYASYTMRYGGIVLALFIIFHLLHFTIVPAVAPAQGSTPYSRMVEAFQNPLLLIVYTIALIAVGLHLRHGVWSAFATLGANTSPRLRAFWNGLAILVSVVLVVGFLAGPFAIMFGVIK